MDRNRNSCGRPNQWLRSAEFIRKQVRCSKVQLVQSAKIEKDLRGSSETLLGSQEKPGSNIKKQ
jgi:hypothetical protein